jgi:hypothetical protein
MRGRTPNGRVLFALTGELAEGPFEIIGYEDGTVVYLTPVGCFKRSYSSELVCHVERELAEGTFGSSPQGAHPGGG